MLALRSHKLRQGQVGVPLGDRGLSAWPLLLCGQPKLAQSGVLGEPEALMAQARSWLGDQTVLAGAVWPAHASGWMGSRLGPLYTRSPTDNILSAGLFTPH